jgi:hypothetical protein
VRQALFLVFLGVSCGDSSLPSSCKQSNCSGCCDRNGQCLPGSSNEACGRDGAACATCAAGQRCGARLTCEVFGGGAPSAGGGTASSAGGTTSSGGGTSSSGGGTSSSGGGTSSSGGGTSSSGGGTSSSGGGTANGGGSGTALEPWQLEFVAAHNTARRSASPSPMPALVDVMWDASTAAFAKAGADRCQFQHRMQNQYGENLAASTNQRTPTDVVRSWDNERADYTYASNACAPGKQCGHYTQLVWRTSLKIGCATTRCTTNSPFGNGTWFLTACNYSPPGNFNGQRPY